MLSSLVTGLAALAISSIPVVSAQCESYGIDFQDGGSYFINTNSNESFTAVSEFSGCANGTASVMLVDPNGDGYECTDIATQPDFTPEMSTCPIEKDQMYSGEWTLIILGNNEDADSFAYQRDLEITAGPQQTATVTPTVTYNTTIRETSTVTNTSTVLITSTVNSTQTVTLPASTDLTIKTPQATTSTQWKTATKTYTTRTATKTIITQTITPSCAVPNRQSHPDPVCSRFPKNFQWPSQKHNKKHNKRDSAVDSAKIRARFEAIKARKVAADAALAARTTPAPDAALVKRTFEKRSADLETVTTTILSPVVNTTLTITGAPVTQYGNVTLVTKTDFTTLPPITIYSGSKKVTKWAPTPTKTRVSVTYVQTTTTKTMTATQVYKTTLKPTAGATACKRRGGHWDWSNQRNNNWNVNW